MSHETQVVGLRNGRPRTLLQVTTWESAALDRLHEAEATIVWMHSGRVAQVTSVVHIDGKKLRSSASRMC